MEYLGLIQLAGKYVFLAALYVFIIWIFRSLFATLRVEEPAAAERERAEPPRRTQTVQRPARSRSGPQEREPARTPRRPRRNEPEPSPPPQRPRLVVTDAGQSEIRPGTEFPLTAAVTIGRSRDNSICISDRYASGEHALIFLKDDQRILRDRGSTNGTTRNGRPVRDDVVLSDGDTIGIGTVKLTYHSGQ